MSDVINERTMNGDVSAYNQHGVLAMGVLSRWTGMQQSRVIKMDQCAAEPSLAVQSSGHTLPATSVPFLCGLKFSQT